MATSGQSVRKSVNMTEFFDTSWTWSWLFCHASTDDRCLTRIHLYHSAPSPSVHYGFWKATHWDTDIHTETPGHIETHRHTNTHKHILRQRDTDRHGNMETQRHRHSGTVTCIHTDTYTHILYTDRCTIRNWCIDTQTYKHRLTKRPKDTGTNWCCWLNI